MARIMESAKWFLFAVKADDRRRASYWKWLSRVRRAETSARQEAVERLPAAAVDIAPTTGHSTADGGWFEGVPEVVEEVGRIRARNQAERNEKPYLVDYAVTDLTAASPLLRFALSDGAVSPAARYLGMVPILTGITVLASPFVEQPGFSGSQLFHSDWEDRRQVKVFVHCTDVKTENGPLTAVSAEASRHVKDAVDYHYGGPGFRLPDDEVLPRIGEHELTTFVGPTGSITFIDTSSCLHLGSRVEAGASERLVVQFQYLTPAAFDLQFAPRRRARRFAGIAGDFTPVQRLVLGAVR